MTDEQREELVVELQNNTSCRWIIIDICNFGLVKFRRLKLHLNRQHFDVLLSKNHERVVVVIRRLLNDELPNSHELVLHSVAQCVVEDCDGNKRRVNRRDVEQPREQSEQIMQVINVLRRYSLDKPKRERRQ